MTKKLLPVFLCLIVMFQLHAQDDIEQAIEEYLAKLEKVDAESIKTKYFLNKGFHIDEYIADFLEFKEHKEDNFILMDKKLFKKIYRGLRKSYTKKNQKIPKIKFKELRDKYKPLKDRVPVSILQVRGNWLESYEIDENIQAQAEGYALNKNYGKLDIFNASVLKRKVYSGTVTFDILSEAFYIKNTNRIKSISIDLSDGKGFQTINKGDSVTANYEATGEKVIAVKFELNNKEFISYSKIKVVTLFEEEPDQIFQLGNTDGQTRSVAGASLNGGTAYLYSGCDDRFDNPVIIVEGFDAFNENTINDVRSKYRFTIERAFRANGRDVIYLNFRNGGDDIRTNSVVLQNLIKDVNAHKIGNGDIIVIGESMGGLVARHAIRKLEMSRYTHNISHYISFDAPHLGANVPPGFVGLLESFEAVSLRKLFNIVAADIREANTYLNSKAAKQMLLRYRGANPHPDFTSLQNEFNNMGFPSQGGIRNIAIVNGALDGSVNEPAMQYNPGDMILGLSGTLAGTLNVKAFVYTNRTNTRSQVSKLQIKTLGAIKTTNKNKYYNFNAFNYDLASGGVFDLEDDNGSLPVELDIAGLNNSTFGNSQFSFVPLFSSLASRANRTTQAHLTRPWNMLQTPFHRVFGTNENTTHISTNGIMNGEWVDLFNIELGLPWTNSPTLCREAISNFSTPPVPRINGSYYYMCELGSANLRVDNNSLVSNLYTHSWNIYGPRYFGSTGNSITMYRGLPPGRYTVRTTRRYVASADVDLGNRSSSSSKAFTVFSQYDRRYGCNEGEDNNRDGVPDAIPERYNPMSEAVEEQSQLDIVDETSIKIWPNPVTDLFNIRYKMQQEGDIAITLVSLNNPLEKPVIITKSYRPKGSFQESYYATHLKKGIYMVVIQTPKQNFNYKLIIQ